MLEMVHRFEAGGVKLALDVNSGSIFSIDDVVWDVLEYYEKFGLNHAVQGLAYKYPQSDLEEAVSEVGQLIDCEKLYSTFKEDALTYDRPVVKAMCLFAAGSCNLRCSYCFLYEDMPRTHHKDLLDLETGKKAIDFLIFRSGNRKNLEVDFFGGEPLLNIEVVREIVSYGRSLENGHNKKFKFTMTTNGLLLDDKTIEFINAEFENVVVSIDGRQEVHDAMRKLPNGQGSYDTILDNAYKLVKGREKGSYYIRGTFTRRNLDFDKDALHLAECGFKHISIEPVVLVTDTDCTLSNEDLPAISEAYERLSKTYLDLKTNGGGFNFFHFQIDLDKGPCAVKRVTGCGAGSEYVAVTTEGDIYPCHQFVGNTAYLMGNVTKNVFDASMQKSFRENNVLSKEECKVCWAKFYCGGGCLANAYNFNGDISKPYALGCEIEKKRLEYALLLTSMEKLNINFKEVEPG